MSESPLLSRGEPVVRIDLRADPSSRGSRAALRDAVLAAFGALRLPEPAHPRFLVVDTPDGLARHQQAYENIRTYQGSSAVRVLCLIVGDASPAGEQPPPGAGTDGRLTAERVLRKPDVLRSDSGRCGVLWSGDLRAARTALDPAAPDDPVALDLLCELLRVPEMFDSVLDALADLPDAVGVPSVRLSERRLDPGARERAWRDALLRYAGRDSQPTGGASSPTIDLPKPLADLMDGIDRESAGHRTPGGAAARAYQRADEAIEAAEAALRRAATPAGLFAPDALTALEQDLDQARGRLRGYRNLVDRALSGDVPTAGVPSGGSRGGAGTVLEELGLEVPAAPNGGRHTEVLRAFAERLLSGGLPVRATADRFAALAGRISPVPVVTLRPALKEYRDQVLAELGVGHDEPGDPRQASARKGAWLRGSGSVGAGALGALWHGPLLVLALVVPALALVAALLGARRLSSSGAARFRLTAGTVVGAVVGGVIGPSTLWVGGAGLVVALAVISAVLANGWHHEVYGWNARRYEGHLRDALDGLDALLGRAVREQWAGEERQRCADAAVRVSGVLRTAAETALSEADQPDYPDYPDYPDHPGRPGHQDEEPAAAAGEVSWQHHDMADNADASVDDAWLLSSSAVFQSDDEEDEEELDGLLPWERPDRFDGAAPAERSRDDAGDEQGNGFGRVRRAGAASATRSGTHLESGGGDRRPLWVDHAAGVGGPELVPTLVADLADATVAELAQYWGMVDRGRGGAAAQGAIRPAVTAMLRRAHLHLRQHDVVRPPFASPDRVRPGTTELQGLDPEHLASSGTEDSPSSAAVTLASVAQQPLLDRDPTRTPWLRFAPAAAGDERAGDPEAADAFGGSAAVWLSSGRFAGRLGLVPLRRGAVRTVRAVERETPERDAEAGWST